MDQETVRIVGKAGLAQNPDRSCACSELIVNQEFVFGTISDVYMYTVIFSQTVTSALLQGAPL